MRDLQQKIQKTRTNFDDFSRILKKRMSEVQKQDEPVKKNAKGCKEGYLFLLEKSEYCTSHLLVTLTMITFQRLSAPLGRNISVVMTKIRRCSVCYRTINLRQSR